MSRHQKDPLRPLTADERIALTHLSRSPSAPAAQVERARALLAIADGASYTAAAHQVRRRHTQTISAWVSRFEQTARCWNEQPTPFVWNGKRRQRRRRPCGALIHRLGGSGACTQPPLRRNRPKGASECQIPRQTTH